MTTNQPSHSLATALLPSLPALMHSSGDALPEHVSPQSVALLSTLIERYISSLVVAAMDAHDVYTDGTAVGGAAALGIPPFRKRCHRETGVLDGKTTKMKKQRRIDYWDEPLPSEHDGTPTSDDDEDDDDAPLLSSSSRRRNSSSSLPAEPSSSSIVAAASVAASLDLHPTRTTRHYSNKMDVRSFIFPICHDAILYQRVKEVQSQRRRIGRDVQDGCWMRVVREEGEGLLGNGAVLDVWDAVWKRDTVVGDGVGGGGASMALVRAGLVDGEGAEVSCWSGVDALGVSEICWEEMGGEDAG
ncbi:hypothetical protein HJC23_013746 [Cyclotella cryptica]|uniref:Bromodomain associated domain-containing protein n=1 Tax=Cyclotella cryptica TaxID=29204 RepID=A0ABD3PIF2_9STRA|eukprot:CCRYP_014432-RA/>CCRYP_014432-RA protein AED:0.00 eAED:0.00 QI:356/-1/1/1/-1/1/1/431/300